MQIFTSKAQCIDGICECHCTCCTACFFPRDNFCELCEPGWSGTSYTRCQRSKNNSSFYMKYFNSQYFTNERTNERTIDRSIDR